MYSLVRVGYDVHKQNKPIIQSKGYITSKHIRKSTDHCKRCLSLNQGVYTNSEKCEFKCESMILR